MEERLRKAIKFFRSYQEKSDKALYRKAVLRFADLVEEYLAGVERFMKDAQKDPVEIAEEIFETKAR